MNDLVTTSIAAPTDYLDIPKNAYAKEAVAYKTLRSALYGLQSSSTYRAGEPFENHPWVYAAAMAVALNISQVPFNIYRETDDELQKRMKFSLKNYGKWNGPLRGHRRTAIQRHARKRQRNSGFRSKAIEEDYQHPLSQLFIKVNPHMVDSQLWQITTIDLMTKGEHFWRLLNEAGEPIGIGETPSYIWPTNPNQMDTIIHGGEFIGWKFTQKKSDGQGGFSGRVQNLQIWQVIQFKFIDPENPLRGMAPLIPVIGNVKLDVSTIDHNQSTMSNGADPGGLLINEEGFDDEIEERKFLEKYNQRHRGEKNTGRTGILSGGWKYFQTGMSVRDMDYPNLKIWNRDEILAAMRTPKSVLGVTDALNYATQLGQDNNFWNKTVIPLLKYYETIIDGTLLFEEPDNIVGLFDLSGVEALRAGLKDQVDIAKNMSGADLHVPPSLAFEKVGLDMEEYEGSDVALMSPLLSTIDTILNPEEPEIVEPEPTATEEPEEDPVPDSEEKPVEETGKSNILIVSKANKLSLWKKYIYKVHSPMMLRTSAQWRKYIKAEKKLQLAKFDEIAGDKSWDNGTIGLRVFESDDGYKPYNRAISAESVILDLNEAAKRLGIKIRPVYDKSLEEVYDYTVEEIGGVAVFELDDPDIIEFYNTAEKTLVGTAPKTLYKNVLGSIRAGIEAGETISELRSRIGKVFDISSSSPKTLQIARTESTFFTNGAKDVMYKKASIQESEWVTAGDEDVRDNHTTYGSSGPHPIDFNYLSLVGLAGTLRYPGEKGAPTSEVINCRCTKIPVI